MSFWREAEPKLLFVELRSILVLDLEQQQQQQQQKTPRNTA